MYFVKSSKKEATLSGDGLVTTKMLVNRKPETILFYEFEMAVVLDVILDDTHPEFETLTLDATSTPSNIDGSEPKTTDPKYEVIGAIKFRFIESQRGIEKKDLFWAIPLDVGITEYPVMNEFVSVVKYNNNYYYTRRISANGLLNSSADFGAEPYYGLRGENKNEYTDKKYDGPESKMDHAGKSHYKGVLGKYFKFNKNIRKLKRREGDLIIESRFGSSARFGAYVGDKNVDAGEGDMYGDGGGNPYILIRNRQKDIKSDIPSHKFAHGYVEESIKDDGSSIHMTSGKYVSKFVPFTKKQILSKDKAEEQPKYSPDGITEFVFPKLAGNQIIFNSDRLIFSSRTNEIMSFAKKRYSIVTDGEFTVDSHDKAVVTTNTSATINSPIIYLGQHDAKGEPVLLGKTSIEWLRDQCNVLISIVDVNIAQAEWSAEHLHTSGGTPTSAFVASANAMASSLRTYKQQLITLRDNLPTLMSTRVFTVGGGHEPGFDGGTIENK